MRQAALQDTVSCRAALSFWRLVMATYNDLKKFVNSLTKKQLEVEVCGELGMNVYFYGPHYSGWACTTFRWWKKGWAGDQFDVIEKPELEARVAAAKLLGDEVVDHLPAFCYDEDCEPCSRHDVK